MIDLKLTTAEAIAVHHELGLMEVLLNPKTADEIKLELLKYERSPEAISGYKKLTAELDKLAEKQSQILSEWESDRTDSIEKFDQVVDSVRREFYKQSAQKKESDRNA